MPRPRTHTPSPFLLPVPGSFPARSPAVKLNAPAKINLSLSVLGKRPDGFHEIETVMARLDLADTLTLERDAPFGFTCTDATLPDDDSNLVVRAAKLFFETAGLPPRGRVHLEKRIPHGAGLGGGSSDAAAILLGLNEAFGSPLTAQALHGLAAAVGSDVPFFLARGAAICRGRGERVEPVELREALPLLLVKPGFGVPTPWAYRRWALSRELPGVPYGAQTFPWGVLVNDLERPVFEKYLFLATLKQWLLAQPESAGALMSGSGATCFAVLRRAEEGPALEARVRESFAPVWTALCHTRP